MKYVKQLQITNTLTESLILNKQQPIHVCMFAYLVSIHEYFSLCRIQLLISEPKRKYVTWSKEDTESVQTSFDKCITQEGTSNTGSLPSE